MGSKWKNPSCSHDTATRVFSVGKTHIWAGAQDELLERFDWKLVISAIGYKKFAETPLSANKSAHELLPKALLTWEPPPCVGIDWPDGGIPALSAEWWDTLATALREIKGDTGLCCMGGHGRTGTMLAILAVKFGKVKKEDCPVEWVRERYCKKAVETNSQLDYIERVTGAKVPSEASGFLASHALTQAGSSYPYSHPDQTMAVAIPVNPTVPSSSPPVATANATVSGLGAGGVGVGAGAEFTDDELLSAWFDSDDDVIKVVASNGRTQYLRPVWDDEGGLAGWQGTGPD